MWALTDSHSFCEEPRAQTVVHIHRVLTTVLITANNSIES